MAQVDATPTKMRQFAVFLDELRSSLEHKKSDIKHSFEYVSQTWHDAKYNQFERSFTETMRDLEQFLKMTHVYADFLRRKAAKLDVYLKGP
jgi:hypothetical protein